MRCAKCDWPFISGEMIFHSKHGGCHCYICQNCAEREHMPNIKITAEVDGKQVPLETVSTETFEAIKALEKPKEIPVARLGDIAGSPRLVFRPSQNIQLEVGRVYALDLRDGDLGADWTLEDDDSGIEQYENIKPL